MSESKIQSAIMDYLDAALPSTYRAIHINNTPRSAIHGAILKRMGLRRGVPDIAIIRDGGAVAFIEVKGPKGRLSEPQEEWRDWCNKNSIPWALCRGIGDVQAALLDWNVPIKARAA